MKLRGGGPGFGVEGAVDVELEILVGLKEAEWGRMGRRRGKIHQLLRGQEGEGVVVLVAGRELVAGAQSPMGQMEVRVVRQAEELGIQD